LALENYDFITHRKRIRETSLLALFEDDRVAMEVTLQAFIANVPKEHKIGLH